MKILFSVFITVFAVELFGKGLGPCLRTGRSRK